MGSVRPCAGTGSRRTPRLGARSGGAISPGLESRNGCYQYLRVLRGLASCSEADAHDGPEWVKPGHLQSPLERAGYGFRKAPTALPRRTGPGSVHDWRDKNCLPPLSPVACHPMRVAALCNVANPWYSVQVAQDLTVHLELPGQFREPPYPCRTRTVGSRRPLGSIA